MSKFISFFVFLLLLSSCENRDSAKSNLLAPPIIIIDSVIEKIPEQTALQKQLDSLFGQLNSSGAFNGSILVAKHGSILFRKNYGYSNKQTNQFINDSSSFQLASVSKVITATALLILFERGLIDLEKPVSFYLPDFPYEKITIKQLLTHRSGLPNYLYALNSELCQSTSAMTNLEMYCHILEKKPAVYLRPNRRFNYCNTNYALLPILIEKISGKSFNQYLKEEIFTPAGMKNTKLISEINFDADNVTKPYDERWKAINFEASDFVLGDKSVYSTPYDLYLFSEALYQNKILREETQKLAYKPHSKEKRESNYGMGWRLKDFRDSIKKEVFHNGWWHGYRSSFHRRLNDSVTIVILSNQLNKAAYHTYLVYQLLDRTTEAEIHPEDE